MTIRIGIFLLLISSLNLSANDSIKKADEYYTQNQFDLAVQAYENIIKNGFTHDEIHYNLGNSYFRLNKIGKAILHYEKALKINPVHQDAAYNLKIANLKVASKIKPIADFIFIKWWKEIANIFSFNTWAYISIFWIWMALIGSITYLYSAHKFYKKLGFFSAIICIIFASFSYILGYSNKSHVQSSAYGIIQISTYYARSEPTDNGKELFSLKEGMKVKQIDQVGKWIQITISDGNKGWIEKSILETI